MNFRSRRNFLKAGSTFLTFPLLESFPYQAMAQNVSGSLNKILFFNLSNAWYEGVIFPNKSLAYQTGPEGVRYIPLNSITGDISTMFTAAKYGALKSKMNLLRGFDLAEDGLGGHYTLYALGTGSERSSAPVKDTIDTVISNSSQFYPTIPYKRILNGLACKGDNGYRYNYSYQNGNQRSYLGGPSAIFTEFFSGNLPSGGGTTAPPDTNLSRRLAMTSLITKTENLSKNNKLAAADKLKLSQYAAQLNQILPTLMAPTSSGGAVSTSCSKPTLSSSINEDYYSSSGNQLRLRTCLDLIYMAFNCQLTNMATFHPVVAYDTGLWHMGDGSNDEYHQMAGHHYEPERYMTYKGWVFDQLLYLLNKMDATTESNGRSMLDNSLVVVISNDGLGVHSSQDIPVITFGTLGGKIKAGNYINYQVTTNPLINGNSLNYVPAPNAQGEYYYPYSYRLGRPLSSFYTTLLNVLGIPHSGFGNYTGFGSSYSSFISAAGKQANLPILV